MMPLQLNISDSVTQTPQQMADSPSDYIVGGRKEDHNQVKKSEPKISVESAKDFLRNTKVSALFPENRTKIVTVQKDTPLSTGFKLLVDNGILSVPVYDSQRQTYTGFIDMLDMVHSIVEVCKEAEITGGGFNQLLSSSDQLKKKTCGQIVDVSGRNPYYPVQEDAPISVALRVIVDNKVHRIPVVDANGDLVSIVTQSHLVKLFRDNWNKFFVMRKKVGDIQLGYKEVQSVKTNQRAIDAFNLIHKTKVSGIAVSNDKDELVGNISATDLKHLLSDHNVLLSRVFLPVGEYLNIRDEPALVPYAVTPENTVEEAFDKVVAARSHRLYVVASKDDKKLLGVISLVDLLEIVAKSANP